MPVNKIEEYILNHIDGEDSVLAELARETNVKILMPRMLSGHLQGSVLTMLSKMIAPETILEIGTYTGYSAICMAKGLKPGGVLHTIEINDELKPVIDKYLQKSNLQNTIKLHIGSALDILPALEMQFDMVFIDGDKREYPEYYNLVFDKVKSGGYILADNILWNGKVVEDVADNDLYTKGIMKFNDMVKSDTRIDKTILPLRDGLTIMRKK